MNKEFTSFSPSTQEDFLEELNCAADHILANMSDAEVAAVLGGEDQAFINQTCPNGAPLGRAAVADLKDYLQGQQGVERVQEGYAATQAFYVLSVGQVYTTVGAADRRDLALAA